VGLGASIDAELKPSDSQISTYIEQKYSLPVSIPNTIPVVKRKPTMKCPSGK